jgi:DNA-binding MarR family transcriptional regulator
MAALDPHIHAPARLRLVTMLTAVSEVEFATLRAGLEVSDSVLSKHVAALAAQGYVRSRKGVHRGRRTTWISLTAQGRRSLDAHVAALREIIAAVDTDPAGTGQRPGSASTSRQE